MRKTIEVQVFFIFLFENEEYLVKGLVSNIFAGRIELEMSFSCEERLLFI